MFFVLKGLVRQYFMMDGEEKTTNFFMEGEPVSSTFSNETEPSKFFLICNEDTVLIEGNPGDEQIVMVQMPQMIDINSKALEAETKKMHDSLMDFKTLNPEKRYLKLLEEKPQLFNRVPLYQMASYLGITPESLSRIRKRITVSEKS
ncbi:MAG: Crp/Fnr family transcriptional regulator [Cytophagales bacterium]